MLKEASCVLGIFGALLGVGMGLAGGLTTGTLRQALIAAVVGLLAGGILGAATPWIAIPPYNRAEELTAGELGRSLLMHWALWTPLGAAAGLALGFGLGHGRKIPAALFGGVLGAVVGTLVFELIGGLLFPLAETGKPFAGTWQTRLFAQLAIATFSALGAVLLAPPRLESGPRADHPHT
jgi:hypothetical protein